MDRRQALLTLTGGAATLAARPALGEPARGLAALAAKSGLFFGSAVRLDQLLAEPDLLAATITECSHLTPELALKWAVLEPSPSTLVFSQIDALHLFASAHGKKMRGHTLLWHKSIPTWAVERLRADRDWTLITRFFSSVIRRFDDVVVQWDVVNEPIDVSGDADGLRRNVFLEVFGSDYIRRALDEARALAPNAHLMINEFGLEYSNQEEESRRSAILRLLERLKKSNAPIDGLGLQAHLDLRKGGVEQSKLEAFVKSVTDLGLYLTITELDVKEDDYAASVERRDRAVADEVRRYLDIVLRSNRLTGVVTWGLSDRHSWVEVTAGDYSRFPAAWTHGDGPGLNRGLPYSAAMIKKPMYTALAEAFSQR